MPSGIGQFIFKLLTSSDFLHRAINKKLVSSFTDNGPLPGRYTAKEPGLTSLREMLEKHYFALEVPTPSQAHRDSLPPVEDVVDLFVRKGDADHCRVSLLLPLFAQHLTDAVFQSGKAYATDAPHEIILNQIYGNTAEDEKALRLGQDGKLKTQTRLVNGQPAAFPDALFEETGGSWALKKEYQNLSYLQDQPDKPEDQLSRVDKLLKAYEGREGDVCATGLFQGNMTLGNFAITTLLLREHNRLCDGILAERKKKNKGTSDEEIFRIAQQNNVTAYMKVVIEDYINAFAGQKLFKLDTKSFFQEKKRWCRETPIPYHFNILYRIHAMIPDHLNGFEELGYPAMLANNNLVMEHGVGAILQAASGQKAGQPSLGNTHAKLRNAEIAGVEKARQVLGSFNSHREAHTPGSSVGFDAYDPRFRDRLEELYGNDPDKVEYAVGILAELPQPGIMEKIGFKDEPIIGPTLMNAIARHAFRHILSNRYMSREFLTPEVMTEFGWDNLHRTSTVADLVKRNVLDEMSSAQAESLKIGFAAPA